MKATPSSPPPPPAWLVAFLAGILATVILCHRLAAQTAQDKPALYTEINTTLASGQNGGITAAMLRQVTKDIAASSHNPLTDGAPVVQNGTYANPAWLTSLHWSKITSVPNTVAGLGVLNGAALDAIAANGGAFYLARANHSGTQAISTVSGLQAALDGKSDVGHAHAYNTITGTPTLGTAAALNVASSGNAASGEVVKGSDTRLSDARAPTAHTHPAAQISDSTVTGRTLVTAADAAAARAAIGAGTSSFDGAYSSLSGTPTLGTAAAKDVPASGDASSTQVVKGNDSRLTDARTPTTHTHTASQISDSTTVGRSVLTAADAAAARSAIGAGTSSFDGAYSSLSGTPTLGTAAAKDVPASGDAISTQVVKGNDSRLTDARTPTSHTHAESDITNLTTDLAGKEPVQTAVSQAEAEAGTGTTVRSWTPQRVKQAIVALAPGGGGSGTVTNAAALDADKVIVGDGGNAAKKTGVGIDSSSNVSTPGNLTVTASGTGIIHKNTTTPTNIGSLLFSSASSDVNVVLSAANSGSITFATQAGSLTWDRLGRFEGGTSATLGRSGNPWGQLFVTQTGVKVGDGTNGPAITASGTSPNENLVITGAGGTGTFTFTNAGAFTASGALAGSNFSGSHSGTSSGTNTGDQTSVSGNAGTATALQTARTINGVSFDGTGNITVPAAGSTLTDTVTIAKGGTGQTTAYAAHDALRIHGADVASASTVNLDTATGDLVDVTGTTTITAVTLSEGRSRTVRFTGALTLTHGSSLVLPGSANITTAAGDFAIFRGYASSVVRCVAYLKNSGKAVVLPTASEVGLGSVTNDAQTKAAIVPNTAPSAGQILVGNAGNTAYAPQTVGTDATLSSAGALTLATVNSNTGTFGDATHIPAITVNGKGLITAASNTTVSFAGRLLSRTIVTNPTTTYTTPAGCTKILVQMIAGGGGGGGCTGTASNSAAGGGGGGGSYAEKVFTVTATTGYTVAVGTGGGGGAGATPANGTAGNNTTITVSGVTVTCNGGSGGVAMAAGTTVGTSALGGAGGAVSTNGDLNLPGQPGGWGLRMSSSLAVSGNGGNGLHGAGGGAAINAAAAGTDAGNYGAGGSGAMSSANTNRNGGAGSNGVIIVWEFSN